MKILYTDYNVLTIYKGKKKVRIPFHASFIKGGYRRILKCSAKVIGEVEIL